MDGYMRPAAIFAAGLTAVGLLGAWAPAVAQAAPADVPTYLRASVQTGGGQLSQWSGDYGLDFRGTSVSDDGRFTTFSSNASDLVPGDTNKSHDVFLRDNVDDVTTRISVSSSGEQGAGGTVASDSSDPSMTADGRYVVFVSWAPNLVPGDTNDNADVFLRDTVAGVTTRVSLTADGEQITSKADDEHLYSRGPDAAISPDGRFVVFDTFGALVADDTDHESDLYLRELATGRTVRISETSDGQPVSYRRYSFGYAELAVTSGGRHVMFTTEARNLVPGDTNEAEDVFVRDVAAGTTVRASVADSGAELDGWTGYASMNADGRYVAFLSTAEVVEPGTGWQEQVFVRDLRQRTTTLASVPAGDIPLRSALPSISPDGRRVAFHSWDEADPKPEIYIRDLDTRVTRLISVSSTGGAANGFSSAAVFSANGRHLAFQSWASNLVDGDTNDLHDVYVRLNVG